MTDTSIDVTTQVPLPDEQRRKQLLALPALGALAPQQLKPLSQIDSDKKLGLSAPIPKPLSQIPTPPDIGQTGASSAPPSLGLTSKSPSIPAPPAPVQMIADRAVPALPGADGSALRAPATAPSVLGGVLPAVHRPTTPIGLGMNPNARALGAGVGAGVIGGSPVSTVAGVTARNGQRSAGRRFTNIGGATSAVPTIGQLSTARTSELPSWFPETSEEDTSGEAGGEPAYRSVEQEQERADENADAEDARQGAGEILQLVDELDAAGNLGIAASRLSSFLSGGAGVEPGDDPRIVSLLNKAQRAVGQSMRAHFGAPGVPSAWRLQHFLNLANASEMNETSLRTGFKALHDYMRRKTND